MDPCDLDRRQKPADYQRRGYQVLCLVSPQVSATLTGDNDRWSDDSSQHRQRMLEAQQERQKYRHFVVETKEWSRFPTFGHEWQIRLEQEGIIVITYQAFSDMD